MERIAFLVDATGERIDCLVNPETLVVRRLAGVRPAALPGAVVGTGVDDALLFTGGGRTELVLDLLFDVDLVEPAHRPDDVRRLTGRLWHLAENGQGRPPLVRLVWGKTWNLPGVVVNVAERLDAIDASGMPRRSWLRLKLVRSEGEPAAPPARTAASAVEATGDGSDGGGARFDLLAAEALGDPTRWRELAEHNGIDNPLAVRAGSVLGVPS
ncbi:hypothetical protein Cme02nite_35210 [Catellatospora methionotrophica]|uniref:Contractile injection system tube protein N-terminal domain-containing protein n=1 Tax=Catellatospora methionotrophica TaxID=121620 RepID=A0A8J3LGM9_9ACTN|nr:hypothetical protein [Catellatospora methionotrophica]GIG15189.1 hypothetical protein Cme02nite_35210 [Catellatospora methionotrophica]